MNKQKIGIVTVSVLVLGVLVYLGSTGKIGGLRSDVLSGGCSVEGQQANLENYNAALRARDRAQKTIDLANSQITLSTSVIETQKNSIQEKQSQIEVKKTLLKRLGNYGYCTRKSAFCAQLKNREQKTQDEIKQLQSDIDQLLLSVSSLSTDIQQKQGNIPNLQQKITESYQYISQYESCDVSLKQAAASAAEAAATAAATANAATNSSATNTTTTTAQAATTASNTTTGTNTATSTNSTQTTGATDTTTSSTVATMNSAGTNSSQTAGVTSTTQTAATEPQKINPSNVIISPKAGDIGLTSAKWDPAAFSGPVSIALYKEGKEVLVFGHNIANTGEYKNTDSDRVTKIYLPAITDLDNINVNKYTLRIAETSKRGDLLFVCNESVKCYESGKFSGGQINSILFKLDTPPPYKAGTIMNFRWHSLANMIAGKVSLMKNDANTQTMGLNDLPSGTNSGNFSFTLPSNITPGTYYISFGERGSPGNDYNGSSEGFTIGDTVAKDPVYTISLYTKTGFSGPTGTKIRLNDATLTGRFRLGGNTVKFGNGYIKNIESDGYSLIFDLPKSIPTCPPSATESVCTSNINITPGIYNISVIIKGEELSAPPFTVTPGDITAQGDVPAPTASLLLLSNDKNISSYGIVYVGDTLTWKWSSTNADQFESTYESDCAGGQIQKAGDWHAKNAQDSISYTVTPEMNGCRYNVHYRATQTLTGKVAQGNIFLVNVTTK